MINPSTMTVPITATPTRTGSASAAGTIAAAFVGSFLFELVRSIAIDIMPGTWQIILGSALLLTILFLPNGLGSVFARGSERARTGTS